VVLVDAEGALEAVEGVGRGHVRGAAGEGLELLCRLEVGGGVANVPLEALARDKVARPVRVRAVSVGEEVVGLEGEGGRRGLGGRVDAGRAVEGVDGAVRVHVVDDLVEVDKPRVCVLVVKIGAHGHDHVRAPVGRGGGRLDEVGDLLVDVVVLQGRVVHDGGVRRPLGHVKPARWAVTPLHHAE
jgi:hypothetical protein